MELERLEADDRSHKSRVARGFCRIDAKSRARREESERGSSFRMRQEMPTWLITLIIVPCAL